MDREKVAKAFNEWLRRYIEEPERFEREWETVTEFQKDTAAGSEPAYGMECVLFLELLMAEG